MAFLVNNDNQEKFAIPNGETVIGRGLYLRVKEQSLSRSHAVVSLNNGKVCIKPTHRNPTYFYSSDSEEDCVSLEKDKWKELIDGDSISLLSSSYKYRIEISSAFNGTTVKSNDDKEVVTQENKADTNDISLDKPGLLDEEATIHNINSPSEINKLDIHSKDEHDCGKGMFDETLSVELSATKVEKKVFTNTSSETLADGTPKKRKLPIWMLESESGGKKKKIVQRKPLEDKKQEITTQGTSARDEQDVCLLPKESSASKSPLTCDVDIKSNEKSISEPDTKEYPANPRIETSPLHEAYYGLPAKHSSQSELSLGSQVMKESSVDDITEDAQIGTQSPTLAISQVEHIGDIFDNEETVSKSPIVDIYDDEQVVTKSSVTEDNQSNESIENEEEKGDEEGNMKNEEASSNSSEQNEMRDKQKVCPYGKRCYRKNPAHYEEYSHSTKDDDEEDDEPSDGSKSECPYGLKCYRQNNPHHTNKFNHTLIGKNRAANRTRKQRKKKSKSLLDKESDNDGENQYDFDDSFLASSDDSGGYSDDSDDSDYKPPGRGGGGDDEDEDVDELLSEAKIFIKNKKM